MLYGINDHQHDNIFISESNSMNVMLNIFQSDRDVINHRLNDTYNLNIFKNAYIFYLHNLFRNVDHVDIDQNI